MRFNGQEHLMNADKIPSNLSADFFEDGLKFSQNSSSKLDHDVADEFLKATFEWLFSDKVSDDELNDKFIKLSTLEQNRLSFLNQILLDLVVKFNNTQADKTLVSYLLNGVSLLKTNLLNRKKNQEQNEVKSSFFFENPIDTFARMQRAGDKVEFLNLYDGVNIKHDGEILEVNENSVVFSVDIMQILAMKQEGNGYILQNSYFPKHLKADIIDFSIVNQTITLSNFVRISQMSANSRKHQRVYPIKFTKVRLIGELCCVDGNLFDISDGGIAVLSQQVSSFRNGETIKASFDLMMPDESVKHIDLNLILITEFAYRGGIRYCMKIADEKNIELVHEFTTARVKQTLQELKNLISLYQ